MDVGEIRGQLARVVDPFLHRPLPDLDMISEVELEGDGVRIRLLLPAPDQDWAHRLEDAVRSAVSAPLHLVFAPMPEEQARALVARLKPPTAPGGPAASIMDPNTRTRILAVASGKGGVGKSSVTVNLAVQLAALGKRAAVLDADVWGFSIPRMLGVDRSPIALDGLIVPPVRFGVACISMGFFVEEGQPVIWRGPMLHKALEQFLTDVWWGDPDYLLIDMPPGTGDISLSMAQYLPRAEVVVVTTPQPAAQSVAARAAAMARKVNQSVLGVVENMSWFTGDDGHRYEIFGAGGGQLLADELEVPLLGRVPLVPALREGGDDGEPISIVDPDDEASQAFLAVAQRIEELAPRRRRPPGLTVRPA